MGYDRLTSENAAVLLVDHQTKEKILMPKNWS
jgi:hypothetical protein